MAVAVKDTGTATYNGTAATQNFTFTITSGATLAVFFIAQDVTQSITSVIWDQGGTNQACTLIGSEPRLSAAGSLYLYGLVNPTIGTGLTLRVVNAVTTPESAEMQSYTGTVTSSVASACTNALNANGTTAGTALNSGTAAQSGANGDMYISGYTAGIINSVSDTSIYLLSPAGNDAAGNRFASTGATHALTANIGTFDGWAAVSCNIVAGGTDILMSQVCM